MALARWAVGPPARWAATSNVEVGQTINPVERKRVGREGKDESEACEGQSQKYEERGGQIEQGREPRTLS